MRYSVHFFYRLDATKTPKQVDLMARRADGSTSCEGIYVLDGDELRLCLGDTYSDYKKFDGIPVARKEDDGYFMPEITDFKAVDKLDAKLFEKP